MLELLTQIGDRLRAGDYPNEASICHGVVMPILAALGWDTTDPREVQPEFANKRGRVDFALLGLRKRPAVFIEVKASKDKPGGELQLFEYAFHDGVQLCVLANGGDWSFYVPTGQGTYEDRRVYRLQLDERQESECETVLQRCSPSAPMAQI